jgi:hypothetical protein
MVTKHSPEEWARVEGLWVRFDGCIQTNVLALFLNLNVAALGLRRNVQTRSRHQSKDRPASWCDATRGNGLFTYPQSWLLTVPGLRG